MWGLSDAELNCVSTKMRRMSACRQLLTGMSMSRYLPPIGTAGFDRSWVSGKSREPCPPPRISGRTSVLIAIRPPMLHRPDSRGGSGGAVPPCNSRVNGICYNPPVCLRPTGRPGGCPVRFRLIPRQEKFFDDFQALADEIQAGAQLLE